MTRLLDEYRAARHAWELQAEQATCGYATEMAEYQALHPAPTYKRWLVGLRNDERNTHMAPRATKTPTAISNEIDQLAREREYTTDLLARAVDAEARLERGRDAWREERAHVRALQEELAELRSSFGIDAPLPGVTDAA